MTTDPGTQTWTPYTRRSRLWTILICAVLLSAFGFVSYSAVRTKNATIDEPTLALSGWLELTRADYRVETVTPPIWKMWSALPNWSAQPGVSRPSPIWNDRTWSPAGEVELSCSALYSTPGFNGDAFINRARLMMLPIGIALGAVVGFWSYRLAGPVAAIAATAAYSFDPNFLAHSSLVKTDVALALAIISLAFAVWRLGQRATLLGVIAVGVLCAAAVNSKFSGVVAGPMLAVLMIVRAMLPASWVFLGRSLTTRWSRLVAGVFSGLIAAMFCLAITWACYGFRYRVAPSPTVQMDMAAIDAGDLEVTTAVDLGRAPTDAEIAVHQPSGVARFVRWADRNHVLPQAFLAGFLHQHTCSMSWPAFLDGDQYDNGRWSYFPLAALYKTPIAMLVLYAGAMVILGIAFIARARRPKSGHSAGATKDSVWTVSCLLIPFAAFAIAGLTAHINIGLRNVLPVFPFLQIAVGCAVAIAWRLRLLRGIIITLALMLTAETLSAWPNYIAFFNFAVGGERGGFFHLGDSNLDWGQDINALADWQRLHPGVPIYTKLFYSVEPKFYGLEYHRLQIEREGQHAGELTSDIPMMHGVIAVGATHLQGLYINPWEGPFFARLRETRPIAVLGGTIYLYEYRPPTPQREQ